METIQKITSNFLGNHKVDNCCDMVANLVQSYIAVGCNMSLKVHFLDSNLDFFPVNVGAVSNEHGELSHQDMSYMEKQYQGSGCWLIITRHLEETFHRQNIAESHPHLLFVLSVM